MEKKLDLRVQKTYKALISSFWKMLAENDFERITVNDLCEEAMIRRATFYKHFTDKYDFSEFVVKEVIATVFKDFDKESAKSLLDYHEYAHSHLVELINQNKEWCYKICEDGKGSYIKQLITQYIAKDLEKAFIYYLGEDYDYKIRLDLFCEIYASNIIISYSKWISQKDDSNDGLKDEMSLILGGLMNIMIGK